MSNLVLVMLDPVEPDDPLLHFLDVQVRTDLFECENWTIDGGLFELHCDLGVQDLFLGFLWWC